MFLYSRFMSNKMRSLDFYIPEEYRGRHINLPTGVLSEERVNLNVPKEAHYMRVNPLEDEEEFDGDQGKSDRQELQYYDGNLKWFHTQDLQHKIITSRLMSRLERIFKKQY